MTILKYRAAALIVACAGLLSACGGGGGTPPWSGNNGGDGDGDGTAGAPTLALTLLDGGGSTINPPVVTGSSNFQIRVVVRDGDRRVVANKKVTLTAEDLVLNPVSGQKNTSSDGAVTFGAKQSDPLSTSATTICASAIVAGTTATTTCLDVQLGAVSANLGTVTVTPATVPAYQTAQVSVPVTVGGSPAVGVPVSFSVSCGRMSPATANTDSNGLASVAYTNDTGSGSSCSGAVTVTASTMGGSATAGLTAQAPVPANIQFVSATPSRIYLRGSPSTSTSIVSFKLIDANNNPISGRNVRLELILKPTDTYLGAVSGVTVLPSLTTDGSGVVSASVNAGTAPGPVQVRATLLNTDGSLSSTVNVSNGLAVASGLPTQDRFSLSVSTFNIEAAETDGVETTLTVRAADRLGNPVPDGTTINFVSEGGQVVGSCLTTGAQSNTASACSVTMTSQSPRPSNMRVTVLAWAQGEESFVDLSSPSNNVFDAGVDTWVELGQPFLDNNFNGTKDPGEDAVGQASGTASCAGSPHRAVPNTCDGAWGNGLVYGTTEIVFSESRPDLTRLNESFTASGGSCRYGFTLQDTHGNPLPAGTSLAVVNLTGGKAGGEDATVLGFGGEGEAVPNTNVVSRTNHSVVFSECTAPSSLNFGLRVTSPAGVQVTIPVDWP